jgi:hypothetical protein
MSLLYFNLTTKKMIVDGPNLKRKLIRITWGKIFFSKEDKQHNSIHRLLNTKEQNGVKKRHKKI